MYRRFFADDIPNKNETLTLSQEESYHLAIVLRAKVDEKIILLDGKGVKAVAEVIDPGSKRSPSICHIIERELIARPLTHKTLCIALTKGKLMTQIIKQATEMGIDHIQPIITEHCDRKYDHKHFLQWQQTSREAAKQSINPFTPEISEPLKFKDALKQINSPGYLAWVPAGGKNEQAEKPAGNEISLWIGPEGGFNQNEIKQLLEKGLIAISFGPWVLRVETAVVAGLAYLNERFCD